MTMPMNKEAILELLEHDPVYRETVADHLAVEGHLRHQARRSLTHPDIEALDQLAELLITNDEHLLLELHLIRVKKGLTIETVAERMGVSADTVRGLERYDADPTLATLRRYAHAIEARYHHDVTLFAKQPAQETA